MLVFDDFRHNDFKSNIYNIYNISTILNNKQNEILNNKNREEIVVDNDNLTVEMRTFESTYKFMKRDHKRERQNNINKYLNDRTDKMSEEIIGEIEIMTLKEWKELEIVYNRMQGRPSLEIVIQNKRWDCLLDTGARVNVIGNDIVQQLGNIVVRPTTERLRCANDSALNTLGKITVEVHIGNRRRTIEFTVVEKINPGIIAGIDMQIQFGIQLRWETQDREHAEYVFEIDPRFGRDISEEERMQNAIKILKIKKEDKLYGIVERNKNVFMTDKWDIGCTELIKQRIETKGGPIRMKPRRQPMNLEPKIDEAIRNLLENGVIRRCNSTWTVSYTHLTLPTIYSV